MPDNTRIQENDTVHNHHHEDNESVDPLDSNPNSDTNTIEDGVDSDNDDDSAYEYEGITAAALTRIQTTEHQTEERILKQQKLQQEQPEKKPLTFEERKHEYLRAAPSFIIAYLQVFCIYVGFLSLYWGSLYRREDRYQNVKYLVVNEDASFQYNGNTIEPYLGNAMLNMLQLNETLRTLGDFRIANITDFNKLAVSHNNTMFQEVQRQVHHQKYWGGIYVAPNSTANIYNSFYTANNSFMIAPQGGINQTVILVYETGQHFSALSQYIFRNLNIIAQSWIRFYVSRDIYQPILQSLNETQRETLLSSNDTISIFTTFPTFTYEDQRPATDSAVLSPSEIQLIYALLISFYSFNFSLEIYSYMRRKIIYRNYLFYKFLISQLHAIILALVYALMTIAFRISTSVTFGKLGFLVLWMFVYLFISATGVINEVVVLIILAYDRKELIAPWMIFNIVSNVSVTFAPFVLLPGFYRYGYAMPMYNAYEALKVVFFNTWKGHLGRNIGVLVIWIVVGNVILLCVSNWAARRVKRIAKEERKKEREEEKKLSQ